MMQNHANTVRTLTTAAAKLGVILPADIAAQAAHLDELVAEQRTAPNPALVAADLAQHLGNPAAMTKARAKAAGELAAADAHAKISGALADRCATLLHQRIRQNREPIAAAFGNALTAPLATLDSDAPRLPVWFKPEQAANLDPETFAAWDRARDAHAVLEAAQRALAPLYGTSPTGLLTIDALRSLTYTAPPARFTDYTHAHKFARALAGTRHGGSDVGVLNVQGVFAPTACAELGGTFAWATPAEVARRIDTITAAAVQPVADRTSASA